MKTVLKQLMLPAAAVILMCTLGGCLLRPVGSDKSPGSDSPLIDTDNDGTPNVSDDDLDNDGTPNIRDTDIDGDNVANTQDPDIDGDDIANIDDIDIDGDGTINIKDDDLDADGTPDSADPDMDGDNIVNINDNDIDGDGIPNTQDADTDGDGVVNSADSDLDGDGIANPGDNDIDGDGIPNSQDADIDNDNTPNAQDASPGGTGSDISGTEGATNSGSDVDTGTVNTGNDQNTGETDDPYVSGIGIVAKDTVGYTLIINPSQGTGTVTTQEAVNLAEVRNVIKDNGIALATFSLADLGVQAQQNGFADANKNTRIVITVSYLDDMNSKIPVLQSADKEGLAGPVLTVDDLVNGLQLNQEVFAAPAGYTNFTNMVKDESKRSVATVIDITFLDPPAPGAGGLDVDFILTAVGKKPL